ncbi:hypothetical protein [Leeia sp.]|uniref:hypothetical protein n=1 Tax=Leeia sp. TaxID=2884678 RepID=UPI0035B21281
MDELKERQRAALALWDEVHDLRCNEAEGEEAFKKWEETRKERGLIAKRIAEQLSVLSGGADGVYTFGDFVFDLVIDSDGCPTVCIKKGIDAMLAWSVAHSADKKREKAASAAEQQAVA